MKRQREFLLREAASHAANDDMRKANALAKECASSSDFESDDMTVCNPKFLPFNQEQKLSSNSEIDFTCRCLDQLFFFFPILCICSPVFVSQAPPHEPLTADPPAAPERIDHLKCKDTKNMELKINIKGRVTSSGLISCRETVKWEAVVATCGQRASVVKVRA
jgi:hypothetical protein